MDRVQNKPNSSVQEVSLNKPRIKTRFSHNLPNKYFVGINRYRDRQTARESHSPLLIFFIFDGHKEELVLLH
jgi:hypothetical protein